MDFVDFTSSLAIQYSGWALEFIREQTPEICLAAVQQTSHALQFVHEQTHEICLAAVQQNGETLIHVNVQTPELCLVAVKQTGKALLVVKKQTPVICLAAINQNINALKYVKDIKLKEILEKINTLDEQVMEYFTEHEDMESVMTEKQKLAYDNYCTRFLVKAARD